MNDEEFSAEVIRRLNALLETDADHPGVRALIGALVNHRVPVSAELADGHPSIQASLDGTVGLLGIINGMCGVKSNGWGYVAAVFEDFPGCADDTFKSFVHSVSPESPTAP